MIVLADDFTGSCDTGVMFAKAGFKTNVWTGLTRGGKSNGAEAILKTDAELLAYDSDTRRDSLEGSRRSLDEFITLLKRSGRELIYKKIDSTWRGYVGQELEQLTRGLDYDAFICASSFAGAARSIVGGYMLVGGVPLSRSGITEPGRPEFTSSYLPTVLGAQTTLPIGVLPLEVTMRGPAALAEEIRGQVKAGRRALIGDAVSQEDLDVIVAAARESGLRLLMCGSAGMADSLARHLERADTAAGQDIAPPKGSAAIISGTLNPNNAKQVAYAGNSELVRLVAIDPRQMLDKDERAQAMDMVCEEAAEALGRGLVPLVYAPLGYRIPTDGPGGQENAGLVSHVLGKIGKWLLDEAGVRKFMLTGGETAKCLLNELGATSIRLLAEVEAGVVHGRLEDGEYPGLDIITKAGGFGTEASMANIAAYLSGKSA